MTTAREALELMNKMADAWWGGVGTADWTDFRKVHEYLISALRDSLPAVQEEPDTHPIHLTEDAYYELLGYRADCLLRKSKEEPAAGAVAEKCAEIAESVPRDGARCAQLMLCEQAWDEGQEHAAKAIRAYASTLPQSAQNNAEVEGERK